MSDYSCFDARITLYEYDFRTEKWQKVGIVHAAHIDYHGYCYRVNRAACIIERVNNTKPFAPLMWVDHVGRHLMPFIPDGRLSPAYFYRIG